MIKDDGKYIIERKKLFSQSMIWDIQRRCFETSGLRPWQNGEIPYYITSNVIMGRAYAEIVAAFLRDIKNSSLNESLDTVYLIELGTGHGRFSYYFLKHFESFYKSRSEELPNFCYILSDFSKKNIEEWKESKVFDSLINKGLVDFSLFDIQKDSEIKLLHSNKVINRNSLKTPLIVLANYVFDVLPQELFFVGNDDIYNCLLTIGCDNEPNDPPSLNELFLKYDYEKIKSLPYKEDYLQNTFTLCKDSFQSNHILFPDIGIKCLERLKSLSSEGIMLLSSDKGDHFPKNISAPILVPHGGSFSFFANYNAFKNYCTLSGGISMFLNTPYNSINTGCLIIPNSKTQIQNNSYLATRVAFNNYINTLCPDALYTAAHNLTISKNISYSNILTVLNLSFYDPLTLLWLLPKLYALDTSQCEKEFILDAVNKILDMSCPLDKTFDLAYELGAILYKFGFYKEAIDIYSLSPNAKKEHILKNILLCHFNLHNYSAAIDLLNALNN